MVSYVTFILSEKFILKSKNVYYMLHNKKVRIYTTDSFVHNNSRTENVITHQSIGGLNLKLSNILRLLYYDKHRKYAVQIIRFGDGPSNYIFRKHFVF